MTATSPTPPHRAIVGFVGEGEGVWLAELACGHTQHIRDRPPLAGQPWVRTAAGRKARIGSALACMWCLMPTLPDDLACVRTTRVFDQDSTPAALQREHRTRADTWGRILIHEGTLLYALCPAQGLAWLLQPGRPATIAPGQPHQITVQGPVRFCVEFYRAP